MPETLSPITIFSCPKPFAGIIEGIQRNAIQSWTKLRPRPQVLLFGDDEGIREAAEEFGCVHVAAVATSELGTPLLSDIFRRAQSLAEAPAMLFVNADIVLTNETVAAAQRALDWRPHFMLVARRFDVQSVDPADLTQPDWEDRIKALTRAARLRSDGAIDWFLFGRGQFADMPPFIIGRTSYDNWLLWATVKAGYPLVDATRFVTLVHQRHDYASGGGTAAVWYGPEARANRELAGHWSHYYVISHAGWMMTPAGEIVRAHGWQYRLARPKRRLSHWLRFTRRIRTRLEYGSGTSNVGA